MKFKLTLRKLAEYIEDPPWSVGYYSSGPRSSCSTEWLNILKINWNSEITLIEVLDRAGIYCAMKALMCWPYEDYCLLLANIAESVLHLSEEVNPDNKTPKLTIQAVRDWHAGKITSTEFDIVKKEANYARGRTDCDAAYACYMCAFNRPKDVLIRARGDYTSLEDHDNKIKKFEQMLRNFIKEQEEK
jgi:hypothetical protein